MSNIVAIMSISGCYSVKSNEQEERERERQRAKEKERERGENGGKRNHGSTVYDESI